MRSDAPQVRRGEGMAILVNANAKRGGRRIAAQIGRALPAARVRLTRSTADVESWLRSLRESGQAVPRVIFAAGGDGTAIGLINALAHVTPPDEPLPVVGFLPLGTGNAWSRCVGAKKLGIAVRKLESGLPYPFITRRFGVLECEGRLTSFAGSGWDAATLNDYKVQLEVSKGPALVVAKSVYGYLTALFFSTVPKTILYGRPHLLIENLGDEVWRITDDDKLVKMEGGKLGSVLYDGLASVAGAATIPEYGFGFRAYPNAERFLGWLNLRVYDQGPIQAVRDIPDLWRGAHPFHGMHDWFVKAARFTFSRPVPLQIGGDAVGERRSVEFRLYDRQVEVLDWRAL